ncbi:hypothetical protein BBP40_011129 [Aspergillus hancockii]|nr:hypothetical protein BBP40_011129 [Aspergillus hancockii]
MVYQSVRDKAEHLVKSFEQHVQVDYIGESISQLEHCLQAAHNAQKSGASNELIIAALLHDIGQIIPLGSTKEVPVNHSYYDSLSSASKKSLEFQGGPFKGADLVAFEQDPLRDEMVALRRWDDAAKVPSIEDSTPRARAYMDLIAAHLEVQEVV